jgi:hypothetical protein
LWCTILNSSLDPECVEIVLLHPYQVGLYFVKEKKKISHEDFSCSFTLVHSFGSVLAARVGNGVYIPSCLAALASVQNCRPDTGLSIQNYRSDFFVSVSLAWHEQIDGVLFKCVLLSD